MKLKTIEELVAPGGFVRHFAPGGLDTERQMTPESSARFIQGMVSDCDLAPEIPEHVRGHFERARMLHAYGFFREAHEFFSVAAQTAFFTLEAALGGAFVRDFSEGVQLVRPKTGETRILRPYTFADIFEALNEGWRVHGADWPAPARFNWKGFNGSMKSLLAWARARGLFSGERNAKIEEAILQLRHLSAHPHSLTILTPVDSARVIRDVAELINRLWGHATVGGRLYGQPDNEGRL